ncbi:MAG: universal stress protein [Anaerolineales bacterium]|nr:universal stress protein [Anaerolineales bacterium]
MMAKNYRHILVPLDGSKLAELALADACQLAELNQAKITLLHVASPIEEVIGAGTDHPIFIDQQWETERIKTLKYLSGLITKLPRAIEVHPEVEMGAAAETILDYANRHNVDLIVMATHGRTGLQRLIYGSVAEAVLHETHVPILMVRAHSHSVPSVAV